VASFVLAVTGAAPALGASRRAHEGERCARTSQVRYTSAARLAGLRSFHTSRCARRRGTSHEVSGPGDSHPSVLPAADGSCPDTTLTPSSQDTEQIRIAVLCLVNRERTDRGEAPLQWNERLTHAAQLHSESMAERDYFAHVGPTGDTPASRLRQARYLESELVGYVIGENIGWGTLAMSTPGAMVTAWMASPDHRANILDARFRDTGVGVSAHAPEALSEGAPGATYTQDFGVIIV